ncbi:hypothetical protein JQC72_06555 [Polycladomyces sp. WAk]|uniref:Uncharacterized protein n=1 Tax=Polycladomyces zharkentensis TaxID=2807616 RepID=A0ABS2WI02_9BACL|nr:hypothetical protein [Polycladomyces sp. WAk]MBN2909182.1 hypothetical protein [Polycladomyces sp. WAk]
MDQNTRMLVKQAIDEEQEATIQKFRFLIQLGHNAYGDVDDDMPMSTQN